MVFGTATQQIWLTYINNTDQKRLFYFQGLRYSFPFRTYLFFSDFGDICSCLPFGKIVCAYSELFYRFSFFCVLVGYKVYVFGVLHLFILFNVIPTLRTRRNFLDLRTIFYYYAQNCFENFFSLTSVIFSYKFNLEEFIFKKKDFFEHILVHSVRFVSGGLLFVPQVFSFEIIVLLRFLFDNGNF